MRIVIEKIKKPNKFGGTIQIIGILGIIFSIVNLFAIDLKFSGWWIFIPSVVLYLVGMYLGSSVEKEISFEKEASEEDKQKAPEWVNKDGILQCPNCHSFKVSLELYKTQLNKGYFYLKCSECGHHEDIKNRGIEFFCF